MNKTILITILILSIALTSCLPPPDTFDPLPEDPVNDTPENPINNSTSSELVVDKLVLILVDTNEEIDLPATIESDKSFTIKAYASGNVASVRFYVDESFAKNENQAPYTITENGIAWQISQGEYNLSAIAYSLANGEGNSSAEYKTTLIVVQKNETEPVIEPPKTNETWIFCAFELETCNFEGTATVRYGDVGNYVYQIHTQSVLCDNSVFGDPIVGVRKSCYYSFNSTEPTTSPPNTTNPTPPPTSPPSGDLVQIPSNAISINVGSNPQTIINQHPAGTNFVFESGVHRLTSSISPRNGDSFYGREGAILNGARLLTSFSREGNYYVATNQNQQGWRHGECRSSHPRCNYPESFYINNVPLRHVATLNEVVLGTYYFDYDNDKIYFLDNPTGKTVETSIANHAFQGAVDDVSIRGLTIEKFASYAQRGAIYAEQPGSPWRYGQRWIIENNVVQLNHGLGVRVSHGSRVINNTIFMNGQMGIGGEGSNMLVEGNEISYNNYAQYQDGWEAGASKWANTNNLVVRNNYVHHNSGPGLWTDINNRGTIYEYNLIEYNRDSGIFHEISYDAIIRHNTIRYNGIEKGNSGSYAYVFGAGIIVYNSENVEVYNNTVIDNFNGIVGLQHTRGSWVLRNLYVHDNYVKMLYHPNARGPGTGTGVMGVSGVAQDGGNDYVFESTYNNLFQNNRYSLTSTSAGHFTWRNANRNFQTWQGYGQDTTGRLV